MNNLDNIKELLYYNEFLRQIFSLKKEEDINLITPEQIANAINMDCTICQCYGCRLFTKNYEHNKYIFDKKQCYDYIISYFSREFNPDTDLCHCRSCKQRRGEDLNIHLWKLSYNGINCEINESSLPEAKSKAINLDIYKVEDYPYIQGVKEK